MDDKCELLDTFDYQWLCIPHLLPVLSITTLHTGTVEFIRAEVSYSMKGLMMRTMYATVGACLAILSVPYYIFTTILLSWETDPGIFSCRFWYLMIQFAISTATTLLLLLIIVKGYKKRKRDSKDVLPNEHILA